MKYSFIVLFLLGIFGCSKNDRLPIKGPFDVAAQITDPENVSAEDFLKMPNYTFYDQDSNMVTVDDLKGKIFIADFFFTTCPSICPIMSKNLTEVFEKYKTNEGFMMLSYSLAADYDSVSVLKAYAQGMGGDGANWRFLTGNKKEVKDICNNWYKTAAMDNPDAPGGIEHSGACTLIDREMRIRGIYDGTKKEEVKKLIIDIEKLFKEYE